MAKGAAKKPAAPAPDLVETFDYEQRSEEWFEVRRGVATASNFGTIMASGVGGGDSKTRAKLLYRLAGEDLTGETSESFQSEAMKRGNDMEPAARERYARGTFEPITQPGFIRRTIRNPLGEDLVIGCSPDSLVGADRVLEVKTMMPELLIPLALKGAAGFPSEHRAQCQGSLWVTGRRYCDLVIFYRGMPVMPKFVIERDEAYIKTIRDAVEVFSYDLRQLVAKIKAMGGGQR